MKFAEYWARVWHEEADAEGRVRGSAGVGWSFDSPEEAQREAIARARRVVKAIMAGRLPERADYYHTPMREEVVDSVVVGGETAAIISRNRYGALVLNCEHVMFVDVDFLSVVVRTGFLHWLGIGRGRERLLEPDAASKRETAERIEAWAEAHPDRSFRLYRTCKGLRLLFTDRCYDPLAADTESTLLELGADPLYVKLTQRQACFRARLTSKPWRCGFRRPPNHFPRLTEAEVSKLRDWVAAYEEHDMRYTVCDFIGEFGRGGDDPVIARIVELHDERTRAFSDGQLA